MKPHVQAWLDAHPERSEKWLAEKLADGFDVHHLDGDHANNDPLNLVLIECGDHLMLHNGRTRVSRVVAKSRKGGRKKVVPKASRHELALRRSIAEIDQRVFAA